MGQKIETYKILLKHDVLAEGVKTIDNGFIVQVTPSTLCGKAVGYNCLSAFDLFHHLV